MEVVGSADTCNSRSGEHVVDVRLSGHGWIDGLEDDREWWVEPGLEAAGGSTKLVAMIPQPLALVPQPLARIP